MKAGDVLFSVTGGEIREDTIKKVGTKLIHLYRREGCKISKDCVGISYFTTREQLEDELALSKLADEVLEEVSSIGRFCISDLRKCGKENLQTFLEAYRQLIEPIWSPPVKQGDRVKITDRFTGRKPYRAGDIVEVVEIRIRRMGYLLVVSGETEARVPYTVTISDKDFVKHHD